MSSPVYTIGHSNRAIGVFLDLLKENGVMVLADVRTIPSSRYNPQYNRDALAGALKDAAIGYIHMKDLGGRREKTSAAHNTLFRAGGGFDAYVDYTGTPAFQSALSDLVALSQATRVAVMCAEKDWRNCHRRLIVDRLILNDIPVLHIEDEGRTSKATLTEGAQVKDGRISYEAPQGRLF